MKHPTKTVPTGFDLERLTVILTFPPAGSRKNQQDRFRMEPVLCLEPPARSLIDRPGSVGLDFGSGLYFAVVDPFE